MVASGCQIKQDLSGTAKHRSNNRDIREMGASVIRGVDQVYIPCLHFPKMRQDKGFYAFPHGTQMHRDVRGVCYKVSVPVENRTGKVKPLFYVYRVGCVLQSVAHLLGN